MSGSSATLEVEVWRGGMWWWAGEREVICSWWVGKRLRWRFGAGREAVVGGREIFEVWMEGRIVKGVSLARWKE